jgi:hypothetical protein
MLHVRLDRRQVTAFLLAAIVALGLASVVTAPALADRVSDLEKAESLSRAGQHAQAAELYEDLAKRPFRGTDPRLLLLAALDYVEAGKLGDADRVLGKIDPAKLSRDDEILFTRVRAEVALAQGRPVDALAALREMPQPLPAALASQMLLLRGRAEFAAGRALDGLRSFEERGRALTSPSDQQANRRALVDAMRQNPVALQTAPEAATPAERAWLELGTILASTSDPGATARLASEWQRRNPAHPGNEFLAGIPGVAPSQLPGAARPVPALPPSGPLSLALLLPLSGRQAAAGIAVRDGFLAACLDEPLDRRPRVAIYDTASTSAAEAHQRAVADGAQLVVGPLTKDEVMLVAEAPLATPTLALNSIATATPPAFLYQFALDPEQEARSVARRIAADGHVRGIALVPQSAWGQRVGTAFTDELAKSGAQLMALQYYDPAARDFSGPLRAALGRFGGAGDRPADRKAPRPSRDPVAEARDGPQFVFVGASAQAARAMKPQLRFQMVYDLPVYATSDAWEASTRAAADMDGMIYPEIPWVLYGGQGAPALWKTLQEDWSSQARGRLRLYAFGYDAYGVAAGFRLAGGPGRIDGLTGRLEMQPDGHVQRDLEWAVIQGGRPQPADAVSLIAPVQ